MLHNSTSRSSSRWPRSPKEKHRRRSNPRSQAMPLHSRRRNRSDASRSFRAATEFGALCQRCHTAQACLPLCLRGCQQPAARAWALPQGRKGARAPLPDAPVPSPSGMGARDENHTGEHLSGACGRRGCEERLRRRPAPAARPCCCAASPEEPAHPGFSFFHRATWSTCSCALARHPPSRLHQSLPLTSRSGLTRVEPARPRAGGCATDGGLGHGPRQSAMQRAMSLQSLS